MDVRVDAEKETVWLTQAEMAELFDIERPVVLYHLRTIYRNEELSEEATCTKIVQVQNESNVRKTHFANSDRPTSLYSLDMILAVGYRVNSKRGIAFRNLYCLLGPPIWPRGIFPCIQAFISLGIG